MSTYFVGNALTGFATLQSQIDEIRRRAAWQRREVSKAMIDEMQADEHDDKIDQFEFTVASLLQLGKIDEEDTTLIMTKYRDLCDEEGFIQVHSNRKDQHNDSTGIDFYNESFFNDGVAENSFGESLVGVFRKLRRGSSST
uniref:Uncharacterized protein n=1 Tax=Cyclophora tenuis TaxID=216820 RepID=A0A7S1D5Z9_CYCTE